MANGGGSNFSASLDLLFYFTTFFSQALEDIKLGIGGESSMESDFRDHWESMNLNI